MTGNCMPKSNTRVKVEATSIVCALDGLRRQRLMMVPTEDGLSFVLLHQF